VPQGAGDPFEREHQRGLPS